MRPIEKAEKVQSSGTLLTMAMKVLRSSGAPQGMPMQSCTNAGESSTPSLTSCLASQRWPVSKASISGFTPSAVIMLPMARSMPGVLVMT